MGARPHLVDDAGRGAAKKIHVGLNSIRQNPRGEVRLDRNRDVFGLNKSPSDEPSSMPWIWSSFDYGPASLRKDLFSLMRQRHQRYICVPETTTSVLATAGWLAVLGSGEAIDVPEVGAPAIKPPVAGVGEGQFIG